MFKEINRTIHEPARLLLLLYLFTVEKADFTFLKRETGFTQGNLSSHLNKLESEAYIISEKSFKNKRPLTIIRITEKGRADFEAYVKGMQIYFTDLRRLFK